MLLVDKSIENKIKFCIADTDTKIHACILMFQYLLSFLSFNLYDIVFYDFGKDLPAFSLRVVVVLEFY